MSYQAQADLEADADFQARDRACVLQQSATFKDDARPDIVALADACLRDDAGPIAAFRRMAAGGPGVADKVQLPNGDVDQSLVTDADLLSLTQADYPAVAALYFAADGSRLP